MQALSLIKFALFIINIQRSGIVEPYLIRDQVARVQSRPLAAASERLALQ